MHQHLAKALIVIFAVLSMAGCGTTGSVSLDIRSGNGSSFSFRDERPHGQRQSHKDDGPTATTVFYGDDNLIPPPVEMLRATLANELSEVLAGKEVTLTEFVVSVAEPTVSIDVGRLETAAQSVPNPSPLGMVLAAPVIFGIESIRSEKLVHVEIRGKVDQEEFLAFYSERFRGRVTENNIRSVLVSALDEVVSSVRRIAMGTTPHKPSP